MKNPPDYKKIIKGSIPLTVDLYMHFTGKLLHEDEAKGVNNMIVAIYNAGKNGIIDPDLKAKFEEFYKLYPRKKSPKLALKAYTTARKDVEHDIIMKGLREQLAEINTQFNIDETKVKHPASWLNAGDWMNEVKGKPSINSNVMTDDEIFSTECGQRALKRGFGYALKHFVTQYDRLPNKEEGKAIVELPLNNGKFMKAESKKLNHYLKDK